MDIRVTGKSHRYDPGRLASAVAEATGWADLIRRLGLTASGGQRRVLQQKVTELGLDTGHFVKQRSRNVYSDDDIRTAAAGSTTVREVAVALGATPAPGTLSHLARRINDAGIDISHFPGQRRGPVDTTVPYTRDELAVAAAAAHSIREVARILGAPDDGRSRTALSRRLKAEAIDTSHFRHARLHLCADALRAAVPAARSYADVMRALGLAVNDTNRRRLRRKVAELGLSTEHFQRRAWGTNRACAPRRTAARTLVVLPAGSARTSRVRLHAALEESGVPCRCVACGNPGEWLGKPITLQIDHIDGNWLDNRLENLRYLCPNCHALTDTWCRRKSARSR